MDRAGILVSLGGVVVLAALLLLPDRPGADGHHGRRGRAGAGHPAVQVGAARTGERSNRLR